MKPPVIVAVCVRCNDPIYADEARVNTRLGKAHARHAVRLRLPATPPANQEDGDEQHGSD